MSLRSRIAEQVALLPPAMKALLDQQLQAGNELIDLEIGHDERAGNVALVMNHPFQFVPQPLPYTLTYREWENRGIDLFEYRTVDGKWSLLTVKSKPIKFEPLAGPPAPPTTEELQARSDRIHEQQRLARAAAAAEYDSKYADRDDPRDQDREMPVFATQPPVRVVGPDSDMSDPLARFRQSMVMNFDMWHDGLGYDLDVLTQMSGEQLQSIERELRARQPLDWRDVEALSRIQTPSARSAVVAALTHPDPHVRREAMQHAADELDPVERERLLLNQLDSDDLFGGLSTAIDEASEFHPPAVIDKLLLGVLERRGETAVHFAALLYFIHGKAESTFDWSHRPFFLKFHTTDRNERKQLFSELCKAIGIDPKADR